MNSLRLMRYHDGELSRPAERHVERELQTDPLLQVELESYQAIGELVRDWGEHRSRAHTDIVDDVMRAVDARPYSRRAPRKRAPRVLTWGSLAVGLAAGIALLVRASSAPVYSPQPGAATLPKSEGSVAIESVDFGARGGTVFMVSTTSSDTPVVWTDDDEAGDEPERSEAL